MQGSQAKLGNQHKGLLISLRRCFRGRPVTPIGKAAGLVSRSYFRRRRGDRPESLVSPVVCDGCQVGTRN